MPPYKKPWEKYKLTRHNFVVFDEVFHVTHIGTAQKILTDKVIHPSLIRDESILNTDRIEVNWLSPNWWAPGYIYGNMRFAFDFNKLAADKQIYWVEEIKKYNPIAIRFLITQTGYEDSRLKPYDPSIDDGPLKFKNDKWLRHNDLNLELMVDESLKLRKCQAIDFVKHHDTICSINNSCQYIGMTAHQASVPFLAMLLLDKSPIHLKLLLKDTAKGIGPGELEQAISYILAIASKVIYTNEFPGLSIYRKINLLQPLFVYLANGQKSEFKIAISIFKSVDEFQMLFVQLIQDKLGITDFDFLD